MTEQLPEIRSNDDQFRKYRELAKMLRELRDEPDDCDWDVIEVAINNGGMTCREPELVQKSD